MTKFKGLQWWNGVLVDFHEDCDCTTGFEDSGVDDFKRRKSGKRCTCKKYVGEEAIKRLEATKK